MNNINEIWDIYRACWNEKDAIARSEKLQNILTDDFEYRDPNFEIAGYAELSDYMKEFQEQFEGASFITTEISTHHNRSLIHWNMLGDNKEVLSNGTSFVLCENNRLKQITGFFKED